MTTTRALDDVIPEFVARRGRALCGLRLRDLCGEMHALLPRARRQRAAARAVPPGASARAGDAAAARRCGRWCATRSITCRSTSSRAASRRLLLVVYPPGIATIVPGERLGERAQPMLEYLKMFERSANLFPGFEAEIQGVYREIEPDGSVRFYTYVVRE